MEERDLLGAVIEHPEDDEPRLVYADRRLDRGDQRGEFIQRQCRLAALANGAPGRDELLAPRRRADGAAR